MDYASLKIGTTLHMGAYRIMKVLGQGGFGITYLAHDINLDKPVAIKEFFPESLCGRDSSTNHITVGTQSAHETVTDLKQRFLKEARNIAKLSHPNIIRIYTAFEENNTAYYVMEYVHGKSLDQIVREDGPLPQPRAIDYIEPIGRALEYLHANHMTHLDVKPANIMVSQENVPILIDFGLSKNYDTAGAPTTTTGPLGVSPGFSPTEQYMLSGNTGFSPKSDLYSLAATLYYLLTAITPSEAPMNDASAMPFPHEVTLNVKEAIITAMSPMPAQRHETVRHFLSHLHAVSGPSFQQPIAQQNTVVATPKPQPVYQDASPSFPQPEKKSNKGIIFGFVGGVVVLAGLLVFFFTRDNDKSGNIREFTTVGEETGPIIEEKSPYGPFDSQKAIETYIERFFRWSGQGTTDSSFLGDNIETDFGTKTQFTRSGYIQSMNKYWNSQHFKRGEYDFDWNTLKYEPTPSGGLEVSFSYIYKMICERDSAEYIREFECNTQWEINKDKEIIKTKERSTKLDEWYNYDYY